MAHTNCGCTKTEYQRSCADLIGPNAALEDNHHPPHVDEDIFTTLNGGIYFVKFDLSEAYLQVEVEPGYREYLTIGVYINLPDFYSE
ncbi:unnamed protein product [Hymenolepis diminuta]|uniref:Reverse transcriptase domain-containing protein n=1 Tax=Hymenolepis diminuta TaxID=6216 RepID=A0A0R3S827_HYMDI|nr:unnamed protein product [Hymenolepis diminuta]